MINFRTDDLKFYRFYRARVLDNDDSLKLGRVKLNVLTLFDGISKDDLPWATPAMPLFTGSGSGYGNFAVPEVGSQVWCFFEAGDFNQPVYFAEAPDGVRGLPSERTTNYPYRKVFKSKNGVVIYIDDADLEIKVNHPSGAYLLIDEDGNITIQGTTVDINP